MRKVISFLSRTPQKRESRIETQKGSPKQQSTSSSNENQRRSAFANHAIMTRSATRTQNNRQVNGNREQNHCSSC